MGFAETPEDPSLADPLPASPLPLLRRWLDEAESGGVQRNPLAMSLATVDPAGQPAARMVLCRGFDPAAGFFVFYTNRRSAKGRDLAATPRAAGTFHWDPLQRQVRIEGPVGLSPDEESDAYFARRPRLAQIAALASEQSEPIASRAALLERLRRVERECGGPSGPPVARPSHWGGYRLWAERVELWVGSEGRAHDRARFSRTLEPAGDGFRGGEWLVERLQP